MVPLTDEQRIKKIREINNELDPLNYQKIFLETSLLISKENYFKDYKDETKKLIIETEGKLSLINQQLTPLFKQLRQLQIRYWVFYDGEFANINGTTYMQSQSEEFYLKTNCQIDTELNGWEQYLNDNNANTLLSELYNFLSGHRFSSVSIRHIKKL